MSSPDIPDGLPDEPTTKYALTWRDRLRSFYGVRWTTHATERWEQRAMPELREHTPLDVWRAGDELEHPELLEDAHGQVPSRARVFVQDPGDGLVFIVSDATGSAAVVTLYRVSSVQHGPTRAYLFAHGPHEVDA